jgi:hypothetical protein
MAIRTLQDIAVITVTASGLTTASTAYTAGDMLGAELTLTGMASATAGRGIIQAITIEDHSKLIGSTTLYIGTAATTPAADNAANSWSDANMRLITAGGVIYTMPAPITSALNSAAYVGNLNLPFTTTSSANLFLNVVTNTGHTFFGAATDIQYTFHVVQWT